MFYYFIHFLKNAARVGVILMAMLITTASQADTLFVDQNKTTLPGESGSGRLGWSDAFMTIEEALVEAAFTQGSDEIRVAEGTYTPNDDSSSGAQTQTYSIPVGVVIKGGYKGEDETSSLQRDPAAFLTILSGDFDDNDAPFTGDLDYLRNSTLNDNAHTVVTVSNVTDGTRIEGFFIERAAGGVRGGGMFIDDSEMDVVNCTFRYNTTGIPFQIPEIPGESDPGTTSDGGGATVRGGQIVAEVVRYTRFINCTFHDNIAARGGALAVLDGSLEDSNVELINCRFYNNQAIELSTATLKPGDDNDRLVQLPMQRQSP